MGVDPLMLMMLMWHDDANDDVVLMKVLSKVSVARVFVDTIIDCLIASISL
jgi:hypothetical protein